MKVKFFHKNVYYVNIVSLTLACEGMREAKGMRDCLGVMPRYRLVAYHSPQSVCSVNTT